MGFTSLAYLMDIDWLQEAFRRTRKDGAAGVDGQTGADYEKDLGANLQSLLDRARQRRADERTSEKLRAAAAAAAGTLQAVDAEGNPVARTPRVEQLRRIFNSATRFPHHPKRRAARP